MTNLTRITQSIGFKGGNTIIKYCEDPDALRKLLSESLFHALALYKEWDEDLVKLFINNWLEQYQNEPVHIFVNVIQALILGKKKIYGQVSPADLNELMVVELEKLAEQREFEHEARKKVR